MNNFEEKWIVRPCGYAHLGNDIVTEDGDLIAEHSKDENARLIAAAPEMLEALIGICDSNCGSEFCKIYGCGTCAMKQAKDAIEKATGMTIDEVLK